MVDSELPSSSLVSKPHKARSYAAPDRWADCKSSSVTGFTQAIGVFVSSSDSTRDVFAQVSKSFTVFWPDCPFPKYVGLNTPNSTNDLSGFDPIYAPIGGWRPELLLQIRLLPKSIEYVLLFLDDFLLLERVDNSNLEWILKKALEQELKYLRLIPILRAIVPQVFHALSRTFRTSDWERVPDRMPYYSSLQVALWKRAHLEEMLKLKGSIWDFENQWIPNVSHYAVTDTAAIKYVHVVEKGKWQTTAERLFRAVDLPFSHGSRETSPTREFILKLNKVKFLVIGYSYVKLKRFLTGKFV